MQGGGGSEICPPPEDVLVGREDPRQGLLEGVQPAHHPPEPLHAYPDGVNIRVHCHFTVKM